MAMVRCRRCKALFEPTSPNGQMCPNCVVQEEARYQLVRQYVKDHPGVSISEVSEVTGVTTPRILTYLKQERLELSSGSPAVLSCKSCGASITTGMYCSNCKKSALAESRNSGASFAGNYGTAAAGQMFTAGSKKN